MSYFSSLVIALVVLISNSAFSLEKTCHAPVELVKFTRELKELSNAVALGDEIKITTLGSSSTFGTGASSDKAAYPARLDAELDRRHPGYDFNVINLGKGGLIAEEMLQRIDTNILVNRPALVLWQTGTNDAIRSVPLETFRKVLREGITKMKANKISVVLVDMQYYPGLHRVLRYRDYLGAMKAVADEFEIPLFRRFDIMQYLVDSGQFQQSDLLAPDLFHLNDFSYGCLAKFIADALEPDIAKGILIKKTYEKALRGASVSR